MSPEAAIKAEGLAKRFGDLTAVNGLGFTVEPGEIFGIVGPDGAGKTTTLRMLAGVLTPDEGAATVAGFDSATQRERVKERIAYMSQRFGLYQDLTVRENILFYADLYGEKRRGLESRMDELLDFSNMRPFKNRLAGNLSGGMKQKLQLVCALVHTPEVLLLDEPTNGVDPVSRRDFWRILYKLLSSNVAILVTTAYLDEAERCNRVGLLDHGSFIAHGSLAEVKKLMSGGIMAMTSSKARQAQELFKEQLHCHSVNVFGNRVHAVCDDVEASMDKARQLMEKASLPFEELREAQPSLEDVFVSRLSSEAEQDGGGPAGEGEGLEEAKAEVVDKNHDGNGPAVSVEGLTRRFGSFTAVDNLSFEVPRGEIFGFLGPNGAGKSTTIRMLTGLLTPSGGKGEVLGIDIRTRPEAVKPRIGYMSQKFSLYDDLTVVENIDFYGGIYGLAGKRLAERREWAVRMAGISGREGSMVGTLSGGFKQRLAMACAVLHEPPIIFLDEPTSGVDPLSRRRFWDLIYAMAEARVTVFVTTHYMEEAEYCDRVALIYRGAMIALGSPEQLKKERMHDVILDVRLPAAQDMLDEIDGLPAVRDAALFGAGLHLTVAEAAEAEQQVRKLIEGKGVADFSVRRITPSMEDVFVSLIEETDRERGEDRRVA